MELMERSRRNNKEYLPFLDGIRGFSALYVLIFHCAILSGYWFPPLINSGSLAVDVFMILSGFVITYQSYRKETSEPLKSPQTWLMFYIRRFFRIAPVYYVLLIPALIFNHYFLAWFQAITAVFPPPWLSFINNPNIHYLDQYIDRSISNILLHITFLFGLFPKYAVLTPLPDWSIGLEMQFYAVFPLIRIAYRKLSYVWTTIFLFAISILAYKLFSIGENLGTFKNLGTFLQPAFLPFKINIFIIGVLLAVAYHYEHKNSNLQNYLIVMSLAIAGFYHPAILAVVLIISAILFYTRETDILKINRFVEAIEGILSGRLGSFLANTSYSVYLFHLLIAYPIGAWLASFKSYTLLHGTPRFVILSTLVALPTYFVAALLHRYVEKPGVKLGKTFLSVLRHHSVSQTLK